MRYPKWGLKRRIVKVWLSELLQYAEKAAGIIEFEDKSPGNLYYQL